MHHVTGLSLMPRKVPEPRHAYTNRAYVCKDDFAKLCAHSSDGQHYVEINSCAFNLEVHADIASGSIGLSEMQRRFARVGLFQAILVSPFVAPIPFELGVCSLEVEVLPGGTADRN